MQTATRTPRQKWERLYPYILVSILSLVFCLLLLLAPVTPNLKTAILAKLLSPGFLTTIVTLALMLTPVAIHTTTSLLILTFPWTAITLASLLSTHRFIDIFNTLLKQ